MQVFYLKINCPLGSTKASYNYTLPFVYTYHPPPKIISYFCALKITRYNIYTFMKPEKPVKERRFTPYQTLVILLLALTQFSVVLDFMVMSPLGDMLMKQMNLTTRQFAMAVLSYAISAG